MKNFRITWEIELIAENPHEAAKKAQQWLRDKSVGWVFEITNLKTKETVNIDLEIYDENE